MAHIQGRASRVVAVLLTLAVIATACGSDDDAADTTAAPATTVAADRGDAGGEAEAPGDDAREGLGNGAVGQTVRQPLAIGRDIIFRAELTVAVDDVAAAGEQARAAIESLGGFLFGQQTTASPRARSVLTFKVLPESFREALTRLGAVGEVRTQNVSADDVTERIVDLESRISTAQASVARLRRLLEGVETVQDIAQLERELLERETTLETLRGSLRTLQDAVALATIVVTLTEADIDPKMRLDLTAYPGADDAGQSCPGELGTRVEEGEEATLCVEIVNTGDVGLAQFEVNDTVLDLTLDDFIVVFGDASSVLQPGQNLILAYETTIERDLRTQTKVSAVAVTADEAPIPSRKINRTKSMLVDSVDPGGLPGFSDGLSGSWSALVGLWGLIVLAVGAAVPFLWLIPLLWVLAAWRRRRILAAPPPAPPSPPPMSAAADDAAATVADAEPADEDADEQE